MDMPSNLSKMTTGTVADRIREFFSHRKNRGDDADPLVWSIEELTERLDSHRSTLNNTLLYLLRKDNGRYTSGLVLHRIILPRGTGWYVTTDTKK